MNKVRTMEEAYLVFELLGIKEVTKEWQKKQGTEVWNYHSKLCGRMVAQVSIDSLSTKVDM